MNDNNISPSRIVPIPVMNEVLLQMESFKECRDTIQIMCKLGIKQLSPIKIESSYSKSKHFSSEFDNSDKQKKFTYSSISYGEKMSPNPKFSISRDHQILQSFNMDDLKKTIEEINVKSGGRASLWSTLIKQEDGKYNSKT